MSVGMCGDWSMQVVLCIAGVPLTSGTKMAETASEKHKANLNVYRHR
jgi:hypothetical protein